MPTAKEQGIDLVVDKFRGLAGPKGMSEEAIAAWEKAVPMLLEDADFKKWYSQASLVPTFMPHDEYAAFIDKFAKGQEDFFVKYNITEE